MITYEGLLNHITDIQALLGLTFQTPEYLVRAFVHASYLNEHKELDLQANERLEFLGDAVLGLFVTEYLFLNFPERSEGELSALKSQVISAASCQKYIEKLGLAGFLLVGRGELVGGGFRSPSMLADLFEALLGAIYLDAGYHKAKSFFYTHCRALMDAMIQSPPQNYKTALQELAQKMHEPLPRYEVLEEKGRSHQKEFVIGVFIGEKCIGCGTGSNKREAEQIAAQEAYRKLDI